ncbi:glycosyl hydrolase family 18 protein [Streptomyces sp. SP18CS02]|uniref:glycosyl hydrolase family 18 protein n=1 Tax=Streptomyces sp. SP18CS02 TaxID=3002531 RepID=UPI002E799B2C|nr:glycosyl hydrolase family 18 protein [Streptomyces sp. SP18CS02]MEE1754552.1 glycosyl hydrolase family 18 protein [Streptomyces sp. SP18CS02]
MITETPPRGAPRFPVTRRLMTALIAAALVAATPVASSATAPREGDTDPPARTVSGWLPYWDQEGAYQDALRNAAQLHTVSPFWYLATGSGQVEGHPGAGERRIVDGLHAAGIKVVPTVNETMGPGVLGALVSSPARRTAHVEELLTTVRSRDYDGLDLDYESIAPTGDAELKAVRDGYAALVTEVCRRLHELGKQCVITVSPQTATTGRVWDYAAIGKAADRMRIMGYDLHWRGGEAGPLATGEWYDETLRRATALVPRERLELALPAYGWDWADGAATRHVTWKEAEALRQAKGRPYQLDPASGTPHFTYQENGRTRQVWYQDARGIAEHLPVLRRHGVTNTALWALNFEDPGIWPVLAGG